MQVIRAMRYKAAQKAANINHAAPAAILRNDPKRMSLNDDPNDAEHPARARRMHDTPGNAAMGMP